MTAPSLSPADRLLAAADVYHAMAGHRVLARREWPAGLSAREIEVLGLLARGRSNKEIAERLVVTLKTVSSHVEHIYMKIEVSTRAAATHSPCGTASSEVPKLLARSAMIG